MDPLSLLNRSYILRSGTLEVGDQILAIGFFLQTSEDHLCALQGIESIC
jgi:hypothetical protein